MIIIRNVKRLFIICLLPVLILSTGCVPVKRGDPEYAPAMPGQARPSQHNSDAIYQAGNAWFLFEDLRARRVGDMLIVMLEEKTDANKKAGTDTTKTTSASITSPKVALQSVLLPVQTTLLQGDPAHDSSLESSHDFKGEGESSQSNSLTGSVTVTVTDVLANGNLMIQGEKWVNINQGEEYVRLRGIVRPIDISTDNTISSTRVADAQIQYSGEGAVSSASSIGWLAKFFISALMPF